MAGLGNTRKVTSLPPPLPKDPPAYPDLYGKRRELNKVQLLEREIRFLEEEIKFAQGIHPASKPCKEVFDFPTTNPDPFIPTTKAHKSSRFWKWLCGTPCISYTPHHDDSRNCCSCIVWGSKSSFFSSCSKRENSKSCCKSASCSCSDCLFKGCVAIYSKCLKVDVCYCCKRYSCYHCCISC